MIATTHSTMECVLRSVASNTLDLLHAVSCSGHTSALREWSELFANRRLHSKSVVPPTNDAQCAWTARPTFGRIFQASAG